MIIEQKQNVIRSWCFIILLHEQPYLFTRFQVAKTLLLKNSLFLNFWLKEKEHMIMERAKCGKFDGVIVEIYQGPQIPTTTGEFGF